tara:strand:+ start:2150 stop:3952 length:1803 start_codon:yes stop_codon:yes gene_type:complete
MEFVFQVFGWVLLVCAGSWIFFQILIGFKDLGLFLIEKLISFKYIPKSTFKNDNNKTIGIIKDIINLNQIENSKKNGSPSNLKEEPENSPNNIVQNGKDVDHYRLDSEQAVTDYVNKNDQDWQEVHEDVNLEDVKDNNYIEFTKEIDKNENIDGVKREYNLLGRKNNKNSSKNNVALKEKLFEINRVYRKSDIYKIFNVPKVQQGGKWRNGYCEHNNEFFIFANIGIPGKTEAGEYNYKNKINDNDEMEWEAQNGSKLSWPTVQKLKKSNPYIFVRYKDFRSGIYKFIGVGDCMETKDTSPVYFKWRICDYKESNDIDKKNEFIEVISAVNQFKKIKDKKEKKPIERTTKKIPSTNNIAQKKANLLDKDSLKKIFYNLIKKNFNIYKRDENPFKIKYIHSKTLKISYWVFLKNISPAHLSNPDISRIQIENKPIFNEINEKKEICIPIGYDSINKVFIVWNPDLFLKRILNNKKISIYSRFSDQTNLIENFKEFDLTNDEKVFVVNSNFLPIFLKNIKTYFKINNNISETLSKQSNTSLLPNSQKVLFKYLSDVDDLLKSNKVLEAVSETFEKHKDNKDFKNFEFNDWFDLIIAYKNHKF